MDHPRSWWHIRRCDADARNLLNLRNSQLAMKKTDFGGANFYSLSKPITVKMGAGVSTPQQATAEKMKPPVRPVLVITGRGKTAGRTPNLLRLRPNLVADVKSLVDGPLYLTVELALSHYIDYLKSKPAEPVEMINASDLG